MAIQILMSAVIFVGLGLVAGILLSIFSKIFAVKTDERIEKLTEILPGLNCGVCGYSGCASYADELVNNNSQTNKCVPGGDEASKHISAILGKDYEDVIEKIAYVRCNGQIPNITNDIYLYNGEKTCAACNMFYHGKGSCNFGCIGYGDCVKQCIYGAISIQNEIAVIDSELCKGCAMCVAACPKKLLNIRKLVKKVYVRCSSCDNAKETNTKCTHGCIGCKKCEKICSVGAITVINHLASIDYEKCTGCIECVNNCPKKCIVALQ